MMVHSRASSAHNAADAGFATTAPVPSTQIPDGFAARYRSIPCTGNAPVNNIASNLPSFETRIAGSRAPSSMRAIPFEATFKKTSGATRLVGRIRFVVCKLAPGPTPADDPLPDDKKASIDVSFDAAVTAVTPSRSSGTAISRLPAAPNATAASAALAASAAT